MDMRRFIDSEKGKLMYGVSFRLWLTWGFVHVEGIIALDGSDDWSLRGQCLFADREWVAEHAVDEHVVSQLDANEHVVLSCCWGSFAGQSACCQSMWARFQANMFGHQNSAFF